jgi:hypothetical protein
LMRSARYAATSLEAARAPVSESKSSPDYRLRSLQLNRWLRPGLDLIVSFQTASLARQHEDQVVGRGDGDHDNRGERSTANGLQPRRRSYSRGPVRGSTGLRGAASSTHRRPGWSTRALEPRRRLARVSKPGGEGEADDRLAQVCEAITCIAKDTRARPKWHPFVRIYRRLGSLLSTWLVARRTTCRCPLLAVAGASQHR